MPLSRAYHRGQFASVFSLERIAVCGVRSHRPCPIDLPAWCPVGLGGHGDRRRSWLKQEIGLGHYEGCTWRGFHHHGTMAAYGFLISERERIPPSGPDRAAAIEKSAVPSGYRPRGAPDPAPAPRPELDSTIHRLLAVAIAPTLQRCQCCIHPMSPNQRRNL